MLDASIPVVRERLAVDVSRLGIIIESEDTKSVATIISPLHLIPFVNWELDEVSAGGYLVRDFEIPLRPQVVLSHILSDCPPYPLMMLSSFLPPGIHVPGRGVALGKMSQASDLDVCETCEIQNEGHGVAFGSEDSLRENISHRAEIILLQRLERVEP